MNDLRINKIYVILYKDKYKRAQFKRPLNNYFEFLLCDFGFTVEVPLLREIFSIIYQFIKYPSIIFRGKLANIKPVNDGEWGKTAKELFFKNVSDRIVWMHIKKIVQEVTFCFYDIFKETYS